MIYSQEQMHEHIINQIDHYDVLKNKYGVDLNDDFFKSVKLARSFVDLCFKQNVVLPNVGIIDFPIAKPPDYITACYGLKTYTIEIDFQPDNVLLIRQNGFKLHNFNFDGKNIPELLIDILNSWKEYRWVENEEVEEAFELALYTLIIALEKMNDWAEYADSYFQEKHNLAYDRHYIKTVIENLRT